MKKINILTKQVYNRIAAGEVVDRPYSAVKELIENSLDAKASEIEIYIEKGGKQLIKVVDNGSGIDRDDMRAAFLPHATSKISCAEDLDSITTLGFRGEALASISAISGTEIVSMTAGNPAYKIVCEDGKIGDVIPAALEKGTTVSVRNLFYNTPVRAKFLKSDKKEETDITGFVTRYILGNPAVSFKYFADGKCVLQSFGGGSDEAMAQVYGAKILSECIKIDAERDGIRLYGYIGNQNFFKANKSYQSVFLNGRYIVNNTIATAINNAYASYMMKRQFPFYVLNIDVPTDIVDVNVHPNKADVRFVDNKFIFGVVYKIVSSVLDGTAKAAQYVITDEKPSETNNRKCDGGLFLGLSSKNISKNKDIYSDTLLYDLNADAENETPKRIGDERNVRSDEPEQAKKDYFDPSSDLPLHEFMPKIEKSYMSVSDDTVYPDFFKNAAHPIRKMPSEIARQQKFDLRSGEYKGRLFNTYLIYESGDIVYLIDQHAAHERLIYDSLMEKLAQRQVPGQMLLCPYIFETNPEETRFMSDKLRLLRSMGFGISEFGIDSFRVDEVPVDLQNINIKEFFDEILSDLDGLKDIKLEELLKDKIAMTACKHAIKGGMALSEQEISALFEMLDGNSGLKCPHGRPVCVTLSRREIEKMFKRIV